MSSTSFNDAGLGGSPNNDANSHDSSSIIVFVVIGAIAAIATKIAIIYCLLKKAAESMPKFSQITIGANPHHHNNNQYLQTYKNLPDITKASIERFLSEVGKEKPIRFSPQELFNITRNFSQVLGSGGFGVVYKGAFPNGVQVAVKLLKGNTSKRVKEQFMAEVGTIGRTYHINLVLLYGFCFDPTMRALVYECLENGSLDKFLYGEQKGSIEWDKLHNISIRTARGIAYLHEECNRRIIHYDIKPGNVLLDSNLDPKVADFGLAKLCNHDSTHVVMSGCRGTPGYAAPELWTPYPVTHKCDVYSYGMMLFEIISRRRNHDTDLSGTSQEWLPRWAYERFSKGQLEEMLNLVGILEEDKEKAERMVKVALWCVQYLPKDRPMMSSVVKMLEGGVDIHPPPNPFEHLNDNFGLSNNNSLADHSSSMTKDEIIEIHTI